MPYEAALRRYEDFLLGKSNFMLKGPSFVEKESDLDGEGNEKARLKREQRVKDAKEKSALAIVRYAITSILGWTPDEAMGSLTYEIMQQLKLDRIISYIQYPKDLSRKKDVSWMVHRAFPHETDYDIKTQTLDLYRRLMRGEINRFPKHVFEGPNGIEKLAILLSDFITKNIPASSIADLYHFFGDSGAANAALKEHQLYYAYRDYFNTPLEYLHESLGDSGDDFLYHYYQYMSVLEEMQREERKDKRSPKTNDEVLPN